ncbi:hypothetical protein PGTUg99_016121 [Puccinia graminis f. sp. tritici]|uniref:Uncharacterized protein n=1 Tax=Puccinia graminis f. sp. tritici TaxID=56615 RepID=A0A5B0QRS0_PUCGR|nr:hypothetical protein PGTUg99_016121 [Puccinia graminis f. sp. tritici]
MVQPSPDSRRSINQPSFLEDKRVESSKNQPQKNTIFQSDPEPKSKSQDKPVAKKKNGGAQQSVTQTESCQSQGIDLTQDSDQENSKAKQKRQRRNQEFDDVRDFFSAPFHQKDDSRETPPSTYSCKWCLKEVRVSATSFSNLCTHRDGSRQIGRISHGCPKRHEAINAGAKLPPTALDEEQIKKADGKAGTITHHFAPVEKFDNVVLNKIVTLWLLRQSITWNRVEDKYLQAAFHYCQAGASLFKRKWAADSAKMVYLDLQDAMLKRLKVCPVC